MLLGEACSLAIPSPNSKSQEGTLSYGQFAGVSSFHVVTRGEISIVQDSAQFFWKRQKIEMFFR
jgi:hypothetical protein